MFKRFRTRILIGVVFLLSFGFVLAQTTDDPITPTIAYTAAVLTVIGLVAPYLINFITKKFLKSWVRYLWAVGLSALTAMVGMLVAAKAGQIQFSMQNIGIIVPSFIVLVDSAWNLFWNKILKK